MSRQAAAALRIDDLTVCYGPHPAVHHLCGTFHAGSLTAVVGPNGAGKSTLLRALAGLLPLTTGRIEPPAPARARLAYLPQQSDLDRSFPISVGEVVALGLWARTGAWGGLGRRHWEAVARALADVGLEGFGHRNVGNLSAGQFQRALFARLLLEDAPLILLDEPFNAIDARTTADLLGVVRRWHGESRTVVAVLHDLETVQRHFPQTLLLAREGIAWGPTAGVLTSENLRRARAMAEAWDERAPACQRVYR